MPLDTRWANNREGYHPFDGEGGEYGSFEVWYNDANDTPLGEDGEPLETGWYWFACFPGCLPDGEPAGPFASSQEAYDDARDY